MKATLPWLAAALAAALAAPSAHAQSYGPCGPPCPRLAPDCCGPGFYAPNCYGEYYGPNYYLYPGYGPFNGMILPGPVSRGVFGGMTQAGQAGSPAIPTQPYARSPRDFFMVDVPSQ